MNKNGSQFSQSFIRFLHRFHVIIFVISVLGALGGEIYIMYSTILAADDAQGYTAQTNNTSFDAGTIQQIKNLYPSDYRLSPAANAATPRDLPMDGRINPFVE